MANLLVSLGEVVSDAAAWVGRGFAAADPVYSVADLVASKQRDIPGDVAKYGPVPKMRKGFKNPKKWAKNVKPNKKKPDVMQPDVDMKDPPPPPPSGGGGKRPNEEVKLPDAKKPPPPPSEIPAGVNYKPGFLGAMAYASRRRGGRIRRVRKYKGKKGAKGRRSIYKRSRTSKARGRRRSYRRRSGLNRRRAGGKTKQIFKRVRQLEDVSGLNSHQCKWVNYESMALCHRTLALNDAGAVAAGLFPFGYKDSGQKIFTMQKSLFGCQRLLAASDNARGTFPNYVDPRTITFTKTKTETTIVNQQKHTCNLRLTKLIAKAPKAQVVTKDNSIAVANDVVNPDVHVYYNHLNSDHTESTAADRMKRLLDPTFKLAYSAPVSKDWKAVKTMTLRLDPGKSVVINCKQKTFKCDRQYLSQKAWGKGTCTWLIEAWGEMCHRSDRAGNQQLLDPIANFNVTSQGANGLFIPGDVSLDILTKYETFVSYANQVSNRNYVLNTPTVSGTISQIGIDMYQDIADDN